MMTDLVPLRLSINSKMSFCAISANGLIAEALRVWVGLAPQSESFIRASLPAIVLDKYIARKDILTFDQFMSWARTTPTWGDQIASSALDGVGLRSTVEGIIASMASIRPNK